MIIRPATPEDTEALAPLMDQLGYPVVPEVLARRLHRYTQTPGFGVAVAVLDARMAGCISWSSVPLFVLDKNRIRIEAMVTDRQHRRSGVGRALVHHLEGQAGLLSCPCVIELTSRLVRAGQGAHAFWRAMGYANEGERATLYLRKEIPGAP